MNRGYVKLWRKLTEWEWYSDPNTKSLFLHLLISANYKDTKWRGIDVKRGQVIVGRKKLAEELGISERSIRTCIKRLKSTSELTTKTTNRYTIVTICNYDSFQSCEEQNDQQNDQPNANKRPTNDQQTTTSKEVKKEKKEKEKEKEKESAFDFDRHFEIAWEAYPLKKGKKEAMKHYKASVKNELTAKQFMVALENYKADLKVKKRGNFIMNGSTFFNNWQDEVWQSAPIRPSQKRGLEW